MPSGPSSTSGGRRAPSSTEASSLAPLTKPAPLDRRKSRDDLFLSSQQPRRAATFDNKRISRDDMFLENYQPVARRAAFHIPLRNQTTTIREAPDLGPAAASSVPNRMHRSESLSSGGIQIGMALGSPLHPPAFHPVLQLRQPEQASTHAQESWQQIQDNHLSTEFSSSSKPRPTGSASAAQSQAPVPTQASEPASALAPVPAPTKNPTSPPTSSMQRSKSTRRKLFGFFGSKRQADNVKPAMPAPAPKAPVEASESSSIVMASALAGSSSKHQPIIVPGELEPPAAAANTSTVTTVIFSPPAPPGTGLKASPSVRGKRPFLRAKASEPAIRKRPDTSNDTPVTLANSSMSSSTSTRDGSMDQSRTRGASSHHLMPQNMLGASPYLNVDIPEASMERYSIMFDGLLNSEPSASSLLARRQATLDKLKTISDKMHHDANAPVSDVYLQVGGLQRRATSPHTRSPSLSWLPPKSPDVSHHAELSSVPAGLRSPRLRSNTSPSATHSPMQADFDFSKQQSSLRNVNPLGQHPTGLARKVPVVSHMGLAVSTMPSPAAAMAAARSVIHFDPDQSSLILDSPTETASPVDDDGRQTWKEATQDLAVFKPVIHEPQWKMLSPPSAGSNSGSNSSSSNKESNMSSSSSPASDLSVELQVDEPDPALKSAVEISIARQISVSRQQREMLRPLETGNMKGAASSGAPGLARSATLKLGRNERLQETKSATPTLVIAPEERFRSNSQPQRPVRDRDDQQSTHHLLPRSNTQGSGSLSAYEVAQNRKSERVVLEAA